MRACACASMCKVQEWRKGKLYSPSTKNYVLMITCGKVSQPSVGALMLGAVAEGEDACTETRKTSVAERFEFEVQLTLACGFQMMTGEGMYALNT